MSYKCYTFYIKCLLQSNKESVCIYSNLLNFQKIRT